MNIRIEDDISGQAPASHRFMAYDPERYDGAEGGYSTAGFGATRLDAVRDFLERLEEEGV